MQLRGALLVLLALPSASAVHTSDPFAVGDFWDYELVPHSDNFTGWSRREIVSEGSLSHLGDETAVLFVEDTTHFAPLVGKAIDTSYRQALRQADGATLQETVRYEDGTESTVTYDPPCPSPTTASVGDVWRAPCPTTDGPGASYDEGNISLVVAQERITVAAGSFDALVIEETRDGAVASTLWFAPDACAVVRSQSGARANETVSGYELSRYRCHRMAPVVGENPTSGWGVVAALTAALLVSRLLPRAAPHNEGHEAPRRATRR